ncbi:MAG: hypothetical protein SFU98_05475 [Leptospiraceae bacterium]|nr:hypothetical protein [Leptospiraceae bacterium]
MRKLIAPFLIAIFIFQIFTSCSGKKISKDFEKELFADALNRVNGLVFFNLLDNFPVMKAGMKSLPPTDFNNRLNSSLKEINPIDVTGSLRAIQFILLNARDSLQALLLRVSEIIARIRTGDVNSYNSLSNYLERLRVYPKGILRGMLPISGQYLLTEYRSRTKDDIKKRIDSFAQEMKTQNVYDLLTKTEDILYKSLYTNLEVRNGIESLLRGITDQSILKTQEVRQNLIALLYALGDMMNAKAGFADSKSPEFVFKELIVNLEKFNTVGGVSYSSDYSNSQYPSEFNLIVTEIFSEIKKLLITPSGLTASSTNPDNSSQPLILLNELAKNFAMLDFAKTISGVDTSLKDLIKLDLKGRDRSFSNNGSLQTSSLETLFFTLSIVDAFGFNWETAISCNNNAGCTNWITSSTGGIINVGDTLWSLQSVIRSNDTLNFKNILSLSATSRNVFKDQVELSTTSGRAVTMNTPVLRLLEKESLGAVKPITDGSADPVYTKTIPWVMNWFKRVIYQGYGPYYNKNKKDANGNFLSPDGSIYVLDGSRYKSTWKTSSYVQCITRSGPSYRWIGLGGYESGNLDRNGTTIPTPANCATAPAAPSNELTYTIQEIPKSNEERAVNSDEEAFYKNFQWLLYEKRFVVIIPARAKLDASLAFEESLFIIAIGNGLKGMMGIKPNCGPSLNDCGGYNGVWNSDTTPTKSLRLKQYDAVATDFVTFSSVPGDSVLLVEGWGYGAAGNGAFQRAFVLPVTAFNLIIPTPNQVFGLIPPVISQNFDVLERLGFLNNRVVSPSDTSTYWNERNRLTPLIIALAKTLDDQVDVANNKNPHSLLVNLSRLLARPNILDETDTASLVNDGSVNPIRTCPATCPPTIQSVKLVGSASFTGIRSPSMLSSEYYPRSGLRSMVSLLSENTRKFQDGALNLVGKTNLLTSLVRMLAILGESDKKNARETILLSLRTIVNEIKIDSDNPTTTQFNLQTYIKEVRDRIATYPDTRSTNLNDSSWDGVNDSVAFFRDYLSQASPYSLTRSADFFLEMVVAVPPTSQEISGILNVLGSLLTNSDGSRNYRLRSILTSNVPEILLSLSNYGRSLYAIAGSLGAPGQFINHLEDKMTIGRYKISELLEDLERFCKAEMVQTKKQNVDSMLYSGGVLIKLFADIYEFGRKADSYGFPFADNLNVDDTGIEAQYWNRLNMLLSSKK